jgi:hypothetical protein
MMIGEPIQDSQRNFQPPETSSFGAKQGRSIYQAQECVYDFLLDIVKKWPPEEVLLEFKQLFIYHVDSTTSGAVGAIYEIVFSNNQVEFRNTLKRCCYILINNWDASRNYKPIRDLLLLFEDKTFNHYTSSPTLKRLKIWINEFVLSEDFEELKLFASRYEDQGRGPWSSRYTSYLLVPQYIDLTNPVEQREAARTLSKQLKDRFKFDLAMYIAKSQIRTNTSRAPKNPTALGDEALRLIKVIVAKRGQFSYVNLANIFLNQIKQLTYKEFKQSLQNYLAFSVDNTELGEALRTKLDERLNELYVSHNDETLTSALLLRTCNRIIDCLTTEGEEEPSHLFVRLLSQGNPITLVVVLLKLILICKHSRTHLEAQIAVLIKYYQNCSEEECAWLVSFLEVFNVTFAIYAENVQYNLIKMDTAEMQEPQVFDPDTYRIFSQLKPQDKLELFSGMIPAEETELSEHAFDEDEGLDRSV